MDEGEHCIGRKSIYRTFRLFCMFDCDLHIYSDRSQITKCLVWGSPELHNRLILTSEYETQSSTLCQRLWTVCAERWRNAFQCRSALWPSTETTPRIQNMRKEFLLSWSFTAVGLFSWRTEEKKKKKTPKWDSLVSLLVINHTRLIRFKPQFICLFQ